MPDQTQQPTILPFNGTYPRIHPSAYIAPTAVIIGDVEIGEESSIWFGCVLRGDINSIRVGARTNIQDGSVIHVAGETGGTQIGNDVTVGHMALLHACTIDDHAFIGMKGCVMDDAHINSYGVLAAGGLLTPKKVILENQLWAGSPAKFWRMQNPDERFEFASRAGQYVAISRQFIKDRETNRS